MAFTSDFIVGFPGETEADFQATLRVVAEVGYAGAFSFKYSPRPGTPAAERDDQVADADKADRLARLQVEIDAGQDRFNEACIGRTFHVLLEKPGRHEGQLVGRSPYLQPVHVTAEPSRIGDVVAVAVASVGGNSLFGRIVAPDDRPPANIGTTALAHA
jgi:tRNA-2-methylthio-N6-dimethylallyladenosine synthase